MPHFFLILWRFGNLNGPKSRDRLGDLVQLVRAASDDEPLALEMKTDLEERVYSIYGLDCEEIDLVEGEDNT